LLPIPSDFLDCSGGGFVSRDGVEKVELVSRGGDSPKTSATPAREVQAIITRLEQLFNQQHVALHKLGASPLSAPFSPGMLWRVEGVRRELPTSFAMTRSPATNGFPIMVEGSKKDRHAEARLKTPKLAK
jgi:hypothetical protein